MTSALAKQLSAAAESTVEELERLEDGLRDMRGAYRDHQTQIGVQQQSLLAVRGEIIGRMDMLETRVLEEFSKLTAQLQSIAMALGTNGSGGGKHG